MNDRLRVGVFGGTFDPIHIGHLAAAQDAASLLSLDRVLFVPNRVPPHKLHQHVTETADRVAMVRLAIADNPTFAMSSIELQREGPSYTLDTLRLLQAELGEHVKIRFLVGCDGLRDLHTWHEPDVLLDEFGLVVMERPTGEALDWGVLQERFPRIREQVQVVHVLQLEISSRDIRERVQTGWPIRYYVLPAVCDYIAQHGLYGGLVARGT